MEGRGRGRRISSCTAIVRSQSRLERGSGETRLALAGNAGRHAPLAKRVHGSTARPSHLAATSGTRQHNGGNA
jgi:hypothetical protein